MQIVAQNFIEKPACSISFISDTQAPMKIEKAYLGSNRNEEATQILLEDILLRKPNEINFLGDVVNLGFKEKRWTLIDSYLTKYKLAEIKVNGCLGNHELMQRKKAGEKKFQVRFPQHVNTGYTSINGTVASIFLNSNFTKMSALQIQMQDNWYKKQLLILDSLPAVKMIIVCCHHSPYSSSKLVGSSAAVQSKFVPQFIQSKKCKLFISGHAHLFQHFKIQEKDFLVIGGGGGLNHPLSEHPAAYVDMAADYKPMFHYLNLLIYKNYARIISYQLKNDFTEVEQGISFDLNY